MSSAIQVIRKQKRESLIFRLRESISCARQRGANGKVVLFGSYARGTWSALSDVDILFVSDSDKDRQILVDALKDFSEPVDIVFRTRQQFDSIDPFMDTIRKEGVDLG